jgi:putative RNA 2'-phosphotransferase
MNEKESKTAGKYLSLLLRHEPGLIGLELDEQGWADIHELLEKWNCPVSIDRAQLEELVASNAKQRFIIDETGKRIRANQGHSIQIDPGLEPQTPPEILFHGTSLRSVDFIQSEGLRKMNRLHVHLSKDEATANLVGQRKGKPIVLKINAKQMHTDGFQFFLSANEVWLTDAVPVKYLSFS